MDRLLERLASRLSTSVARVSKRASCAARSSSETPATGSGEGSGVGVRSCWATWAVALAMNGSIAAAEAPVASMLALKSAKEVEPARNASRRAWSCSESDGVWSGGEFVCLKMTLRVLGNLGR